MVDGIDDGVLYSSENFEGGYSNRIKNLYGISDFYNFIRKSDNVPSSHRHFQVFFYPEFNNYKDTINMSGENEINEIRQNLRDLFNLNILERITLSIQNVNLPTTMGLNGSPLNVNTILGQYVTTGEGQFFDGTNKTFTLTLIDQMKPLLEKYFTKWIFLANIAETDGPNYKYGYPFPRMNVAIKYYREDKISKDNEDLNPNFIYYFRGVYPTAFQACSISHEPDKDADFLRYVTFTFNTCWVLPNAAYANRYKLDYLFTNQNQLRKLREIDQINKLKLAAEAKAAYIQSNISTNDLIASTKAKEIQKKRAQMEKDAMEQKKDAANEKEYTIKTAQQKIQDQQNKIKKVQDIKEKWQNNIKKLQALDLIEDKDVEVKIVGGKVRYIKDNKVLLTLSQEEQKEIGGMPNNGFNIWNRSFGAFASARKKIEQERGKIQAELTQLITDTKDSQKRIAEYQKEIANADVIYNNQIENIEENRKLSNLSFDEQLYQIDNDRYNNETPLKEDKEKYAKINSEIQKLQQDESVALYQQISSLYDPNA